MKEKDSQYIEIKTREVSRDVHRELNIEAARQGLHLKDYVANVLTYKALKLARKRGETISYKLQTNKK